MRSRIFAPSAIMDQRVRIPYLGQSYTFDIVELIGTRRVSDDTMFVTLVLERTCGFAKPTKYWPDWYNLRFVVIEKCLSSFKSECSVLRPLLEAVDDRGGSCLFTWRFANATSAFKFHGAPFRVQDADRTVDGFD